MNKLNMIILAASILNVAHAEGYSTYEEPTQELEVDFLDCNGDYTLEQRKTLQETDCAIQYEIGDTGPAGGTVFYLVSGSNGTHGMESSPVETGMFSWGCLDTDIKGTGNKGIGEGKGNFNVLIAKGCSPIAKAVQEHCVNGFNDWYLGSRDEIELMLNTTSLPTPDAGHDYYWTSSQYDGFYPLWVEENAHVIHLEYTEMSLHIWKGHAYNTLPIRNF
ncbi:hypothetical protein BPLS_P2084 [Bathymodiolus platifrons methanotrophic gill symbiont]|uniref:hypothetical protein n=1 Tax=Bathymodiolus platifrons methanotrophic gill symbiont TaxID=113268 RepID=UPI0011D0105D|nr:hypothetical protein [Bathymodiolus platifrons methanotrophic gill symbiont]TXL03108.1 hypothetical protein BMR07_16130 [Methylococcaceae bacterium CS1]GFO75078.1 hypothetical protein BPLS_P2084 [Bathymodiolus platifrons methanotrophic gill symbiont]